MRSSDLSLVALLVVVAVLCVSSARIDSATGDEPAHVAAGVIKLSIGWLNFYRGQLPLMNSISAIPLVVAGYRMPADWQSGSDEWAVGRKFIYQSGYNCHRIVFLSRLASIALFLALCAAVYVLVLRETGSGWAAFAGALLTGFCPDLMAHGRLATVDCGLAVFAFVATAALLRLIARPAFPTAILFGLSFAGAVMTKVSALILGPYFVTVIAGAFVLRSVENPKRFWLALLAGVATALAFFEGFTLAEMSRAYLAHQYPNMPRLLAPFADYAEVFRYIRSFYSERQEIPQFLLGHFSRKGWPDYYVIAFLLKTTLPAMILLIAAVVAGVRRKSFVVIALLAFVVVFMAAASAGRLDLGIRYVLPIYPFIYAASAIALQPFMRTRLVAIAVSALLVWHAGENLTNYPSYIAYFNELIGSKRNADRYLVDSNLDWGQDLRRLDQWCRRNGVKEITLHYFGGGDLSCDMRWARPNVRWSPDPAPLPNGYFALSRHLYRMSRPIWGVDYDAYLQAQHARYVTSIGWSINVYRVRVAEIRQNMTQRFMKCDPH